MVRKVTFTVRPAPPLAALLSYAQATRAHRSGLGDRLDREVRLALEGSARTLDPVLGLLRWLGRRSLARSTGYVDATGLAAEVTVTFDLRATVAATLEQGSRVDGRAYTDLYSLRALVRALRQTELLGFDGILLGRQIDTARSLLRAVEAACREAGLGDESLVPKVFARGTVGTPPPTPKPAAAPPPPAKPKPAASTASFGGLPDDATSAPPPVVEEPKSARGLSFDAEFFLERARLKVWPCSAKVLGRARRTVLIALHPDRAGEGSEANFRRALKGYEDLAKLLASAPVIESPPAPTPPPTPTPPSQPAPTVAPVAPRAVTPVAVVTPTPAAAPVRASVIGQWPPPPPVETAPVAEAIAPATKPARQSFKRSSKA